MRYTEGDARVGKRDATAGYGGERTRERGDNSERRSESDLERRREAGRQRRSGSKSIKCPAKTFSALYKISASSFIRLHPSLNFMPRSHSFVTVFPVYTFAGLFFPIVIRFSFTLKVKTFLSFVKVNFGI